MSGPTGRQPNAAAAEHGSSSLPRAALRLVLADDAPLIRNALARLLQEAGMDVVAQASTGPELLEAASRCRPDVVLTDIRMPPTGTLEGLDAAQRIRTALPGTAVLLLSQHVEARTLDELLSTGAGGVGYLLKERVGDIAELTDTISTLAGGGTVIDPEIITTLMGRRRRVDPLAALSPREREVLALLAQGRSNAAVCSQLFLSPKTVESHISSLLLKLGLQNQPQDHRRVLAVLAYLRSPSHS